jgi:hypothetical protein
MFETIRDSNRCMIILLRLQLEIHVTEIHRSLHSFDPLPLGLIRLLIHRIEDALLLLRRHDSIQFKLVQHLLGECALVLVDGVHDLDGPTPELLSQLHQKEALVEALNLVADVLRPLPHLSLQDLPVMGVEVVFHGGDLVARVK